MISDETCKKIVDYLKKYNPVMIGLFGSRVRGDNRADSDLDILVNLRSSFGLLELVGIEQDLSDITGIKVDLVTERSLKNTHLKNYIYQDLKVIYND